MLFAGDSAGGIDVLMDPNNPDIVYAATWQIEIHTWGRVSGGAGSGIWKSTDNGVTWNRLAGNGLPTRPFGKDRTRRHEGGFTAHVRADRNGTREFRGRESPRTPAVSGAPTTRRHIVAS